MPATEFGVRSNLSGKNILARHSNNSWGCVPLTVIDDAGTPQALTLPDGSKYLPAGTIIGDPDALTNSAASGITPGVAVDAAGATTAIGVLFQDTLLVDDGSGTEQGAGAVLIYGNVNIDALPGGDPVTAIKDALPRITFELVRG